MPPKPRNKTEEKEEKDQNQLWAEKHKPEKLKEIADQGRAIKKIKKWLDNFKPGQALFLHGPPGVGKTLVVEVLAEENDKSLLRLNASDRRSSEEIDHFAETALSRDLFQTGKYILIDEMDGISPRDRGAVSSIKKLIEKSKFPVFLIANDPYQNKLRPLRNLKSIQTIKFRNVPSPSIKKRLREICQAEGIEYEKKALKHLSRWSDGDLRSAVMDLQMVATGREKITEDSLEILGYRERESSIFDVLPTIYRSRNIKAARKAIRDCDKAPDELFLWVEENLLREFSRKNLPQAFDLLAQADLFQSLIRVQQNYRFRVYMLDLLAGLSLKRKKEKHGYTKYKPSQKWIRMGRTKAHRKKLNQLSEKIGSLTHTSTRVVKKDYLPYLKILLKKQKQKEIAGADLTEEEIEMIQKY